MIKCDKYLNQLINARNNGFPPGIHKMIRKRNALRLICAAGLITLSEAVSLGYFGGMGPFKDLIDLRMKRLPGNAPGFSMKDVQPMNNSPLRGKRVLFLGSSVTYGYASLQEGIPEYFAARFGCDITKEAVSGTTLTDDSNNSYVHRLMNNVDPHTDHDLAVIQLSTNDAGKSKPIGAVTDAIETIIEYVKETWGCPAIFYTNCRYDNENYALMVRRLYEIKEKWGIGIIDLWSDDSFNLISDEDRMLYMNDPVHPTRAGYREWWCPEIERQLLAILAE